MFANYGKTELRKQIGNAVPPIVYKAILESVKRTLVEEDALHRQQAVSGRAAVEQQQTAAAYNVIVLD